MIEILRDQAVVGTLRDEGSLNITYLGSAYTVMHKTALGGFGALDHDFSLTVRGRHMTGGISPHDGTGVDVLGRGWVVTHDRQESNTWVVDDRMRISIGDRITITGDVRNDELPYVVIAIAMAWTLSSM